MSGGQSLPQAFETALVRLGFDFSAPWLEQLLPCLVTPLLFLGPLYAYWLSGRLPFQWRWGWRRSVFPLFTTWQGVRNYVMVCSLVPLCAAVGSNLLSMQGPITEELVFRSCTLAVYHLAGASHAEMIFLTPWLFGLGAWPTL